MDIEFTVLDPLNQAEVDAWLGVVRRSTLASVPGFPPSVKSTRIIGLVRHRATERVEHVLAKRDGRVVAAAEMNMPLLDNTHMVELELDVDPEFRGRGIGSALLTEVERRAAEYGRTTLVAFNAEGPDGGESAGYRFATARGYAKAGADIRRTADLGEIDQSNLDGTLADAWARADGYALVQWTDRTPSEHVEDVAYLDGRLLLDAPTQDLDIEPQKVDVDRVHNRENEYITRGQLRVSTAVKHVGSGRLVAWTEIAVNPGEEFDCWQSITLVDPDHRGHRLGTILKIENHRHVLRYRPMMRRVHTWNSEVNDHMVAINEAVGYRIRERWNGLQKKLGK
ncbi:MAG TPA: GNAT family N-acetyltransferase [Stackebrandtia sp.]|jgi:GNAT superfamily N-acetyltransferase|uniref:GNAT family N-acetyltransferase n=1 Tax=Stackebrandtia sp. TaxID=2023065 RepID=UPI002D63C833|nr:GNAT family N-acetyltransferase [Stackebrandtia sp.]HZE40364.1 GNAT family N-acetyltransferase [Stackebrandtia sp.]